MATLLDASLLSAMSITIFIIGVDEYGWITAFIAFVAYPLFLNCGNTAKFILRTTSSPNGLLNGM